MLGLYTIQEIYWLVGMPKYYFLSLVSDLLMVIALVFLFCMALVSRINQKSRFAGAWFIPFIFSVLSVVSSVALWTTDIEIENVYYAEGLWYFLGDSYFVNFQTLAIVFYGIGLRIAMKKKTEEEAIFDENISRSNVTYTSARGQGINLCPMDKPMQMPKPSPIMPAIGQARRESRTSDEKMAEVRKYKHLLDDGVITEEEFNRKKQEILGL